MKNKLYIPLLFVAFICCIGSMKAQTNCPTPTGLTSSNITANSATVSWIAVANNSIYNVRYRSGANAIWQAQTTQGPGLNLTNLLSLTTYEWQVQTGCPGSNGAIIFSSFSASAFFTTLGITTGCPTPTGLFANSITTTSATLHWSSSGASSYKLRYRQVNTTAWTIKNPASNSKNITGLLGSTGYQWQVRGKCISPNGVISWSSWSTVSVFQTLGSNTCTAPTALTSSNQVGNVVLLSWNTTGALSYNIRYRHANTLAWVNTTSSTNSKSLSGLGASSSYEWQAQSVCSNVGAVVVSAWSASAYFTTNAPISLSPNPAGNRVSVSQELPSEQEVTLIIRDFYGTAFSTEKRSGMDGFNQYEINVSNLKNGLYYLEANSSIGRQTVKFYVQH